MYSVVYIEFGKVYMEKTLYKSAVFENAVLFLESCKCKDNLYIKASDGSIVAEAVDFVHKNVA